MFYFPFQHGCFPEWVPKFGGSSFTFFNAIFNVADSVITIGEILLILFNKKAFPDKGDPEDKVFLLEDILSDK